MLFLQKDKMMLLIWFYEFKCQSIITQTTLVSHPMTWFLLARIYLRQPKIFVKLIPSPKPTSSLLVSNPRTKPDFNTILYVQTKTVNLEIIRFFYLYCFKEKLWKGSKLVWLLIFQYFLRCKNVYLKLLGSVKA